MRSMQPSCDALGLFLPGNFAKEKHTGVYTELQSTANSYQMLVASSCPGNKGGLEGEAKTMLQRKTHLFFQTFRFPSLTPERRYVTSGQGSPHRADHVRLPHTSSHVSHSMAAQAGLTLARERSPHEPVLKQTLCSNHRAAPLSCS